VGDHPDTILQKMSDLIPLCHGASRKPPPETRAVLSLPWAVDSVLAQSEFTLSCFARDHSIVKLHSVGAGFKADFPGTPPFAGIVVDHVGWTHGGLEEEITPHLAELNQLKPSAIFLKHYVPPVGELIVAEP